MASSFQSFSVPTSPAVVRNPRNSDQPVTPQRLPTSARHANRYSHSSSFSKSPYNTSSSDMMTASSALTTPDTSTISLKKRLGPSRSPAAVRNSADPIDGKDKSVADTAQNWRARASQHGIKVSPSSKNANPNESHFGDDEADKTCSDFGNDSSILSNDEGDTLRLTGQSQADTHCNGTALLPPPFLSYHKRTLSGTAVSRPRAQSHASLENKAVAQAAVAKAANCSLPLPVSPAHPRRALVSHNRPDSVLCTPPPNRVLTSRLKMSGSLTDPPRPRKREPLGNAPMPTPSAARGNMSMNMLADKSLDLFDINEHDHECDSDVQNSEEQYDESFSLDLHNHTANIFGYGSGLDQQEGTRRHRSSSNLFGDPFAMYDTNTSTVLSSISETAEHHFHTLQEHPIHLRYEPPSFFAGEPLFSSHPTPIPSPMFSQPTYVPLVQAMMPAPLRVPTLMASPTLTTSVHSPNLNLIPGFPRGPAAPVIPHYSEGLAPPKVELKPPPTDCSVCLASHPSSLAVLQPCKHPLCSSCLTSALNIVGEKDMECAVCNMSVQDFKLISPPKPPGGARPSPPSMMKTDRPSADHPFGVSKDDLVFDSHFGAVASAPGPKDLDGAFELGFDFADGLRASTPKMEQMTRGGLEVNAGSLGGGAGINGTGTVVLRIDNVPWDITPKQIVTWLQQPVERVHVLLDPKGKTLSHAYVEVADSVIAGAILRGEGCRPNSNGKRERGSVLGRGKRARGVTVTRSTMEELMANLFPSWRGRFIGNRPTLSGLEGEDILRALDGGLLTEDDLFSLRKLIKEPDSHFLKVPVLPYHSLIGLLSKFPADVDSQVCWSIGIRDKLFDLVLTALIALIPRIDRTGRNAEYSVDLVMDLAQVAMECSIFTGLQIQQVAETLSRHRFPVPSWPLPGPLYHDFSSSSIASSAISSSTTSEQTLDLTREIPSASRTNASTSTPMTSVSSISYSSILKTPENRQTSLIPGPVSTHQEQPKQVGEKENVRTGPKERSGSVKPAAKERGREKPGMTEEKPYDDLAKEFGVDMSLIQALAQRLSGLSS